jgi:hypothetical protein
MAASPSFRYTADRSHRFAFPQQVLKIADPGSVMLILRERAQLAVAYLDGSASHRVQEE